MSVLKHWTEADIPSHVVSALRSANSPSSSNPFLTKNEGTLTTYTFVAKNPEDLNTIAQQINQSESGSETTIFLRDGVYEGMDITISSYGGVKIIGESDGVMFRSNLTISPKYSETIQGFKRFSVSGITFDGNIMLTFGHDPQFSMDGIDKFFGVTECKFIRGATLKITKGSYFINNNIFEYNYFYTPAQYVSGIKGFITLGPDDDHMDIEILHITGNKFFVAGRQSENEMFMVLDTIVGEGNVLMKNLVVRDNMFRGVRGGDNKPLPYLFSALISNMTPSVSIDISGNMIVSDRPLCNDVFYLDLISSESGMINEINGRATNNVVIGAVDSDGRVFNFDVNSDPVFSNVIYEHNSVR